MEDLVVAAKEAEQDMKVREWRNSQILSDGFPDVIDPTDAVDLPPPSAGYPFAVQSTATHGLGVQQSICAADLADRLPPPNTPNGSSLYPLDESWRRALLHEAVGHSLNNSASDSMLSMNIISSTPIASPISGRQPKTHVGQSKLKRALDQRIISQPVIEDAETPSNDVMGALVAEQGMLADSKTRRARGLSTPDSHEGPRRSSYVPRRAETPAALHTPLAPPPRSVHSNSQTNLINPENGQFVLSYPPRKSVRKAKSSPAMSDAFESSQSTPPVPILNISSSPAPISHHATGSVSMSSFYSEDDREETCESVPRPSMALSAPTSEGRHSFFENDRPSPAVSAFEDARYSGYHTNPESSRGHMSRTSRDAMSSASPRYSTMSPPPRASSSLSNAPLFPPPRSSSLHFRVVTTRPSPTATPSPTSSHYAQGPRSLNIPPPSPPQSSAHAPQSSILSPQPPPLSPIASRRGSAGPAALLLNVNTAHIPIAIHSAPPPASPTSFFDNIHDGMHDLESSEDSDEGSDFGNDADLDTTTAHETLRPRAMSSSHQHPTTPPRSSFLFSRLGNRSTPNVARRNFSPTVASFSPTLARFSISQKKLINHKPVSNVPPRASFFSGKKAGKSPNKAALEYVHTTQQQADELVPPPSLTMGDSRSSFTRSITGSDIVRDGPKDESLRKLDGMMLKHMEAEKDRIRKIAKTLHESKS